jgi:hypothetical protein
MPKRNRYGRFVKSRRRNPARRRNPVARRRNPRRRNPRRRNAYLTTTRRAGAIRRRRRRNPRRRNPSLAVAFKDVRRNLTSIPMLTKLAVGAGASVGVEILGAKAHAWINTKVDWFATGTMHTVGGVALRIAIGTLAATFAPKKWQAPILIGAGVSALGGVIGGLVAKYMPAQASGTNGIGGWVTTGKLRAMGLNGQGGYPVGLAGGFNGMGGWLTTADARRLGLAV